MLVLKRVIFLLRKKAIVYLGLKKPSLDPDYLSNYRPISNLNIELDITYFIFMFLLLLMMTNLLFKLTKIMTFLLTLELPRPSF